ncbi:obscurin-like protein 1 [Mytilus edulis]|uniref:obscurin-like protein 1 n=1 Tax=Mytilus edulis TaxID=6550 RepID=UPI0039EE0157
MYSRDNKDKNQSQTQYSPRKDNISSPAYFILEPTDEITIFEGHFVRLEYKLLINRFPIEFKKNNCSIEKADHIDITETGRSKTLLIEPIGLDDAGEYCMDVAGVKKLFKRPLTDIKHIESLHTIFECETEKENSEVEWFKEDDQITHNTTKYETEKIETEQGYIYKLKIKYTNFGDKGNYRIGKKGIWKKAALDVQDLFKRPLKDIKSIQGSHTIFECETEKVNGAVEWFKEKDNITHNTTKYETEKIETEQGYIYKLKIKYTNLEDKGNYRIEKIGIWKEASLNVQVLFIRPLQDITILEGSHTAFECETEKEDGVVNWFKDDVKLTVDSTKQETDQGYIYKLEIKHALVKDGGSYRIEINCIRSEADLEVEGLFKRQLENKTIMEGLDIQFECETVGKNTSVAWFKDGILTELDTEDTETLAGNIHKLTISPARIQDSGTYWIVKNDIRSEAVLDVKVDKKREEEWN